ncbi:hypothetical protein DIT68_00855 [Brumimicrobium oceani]|uniref:Uncharacterized protein n=1 Tax=Brumimicrobium oceani TaxID=2100725 RepID=A0A2U2XGF3_9FLAO|nr:hypothetical protein DIT68_00855 [Brumimicrobium oceani]
MVVGEIQQPFFLASTTLLNTQKIELILIWAAHLAFYSNLSSSSIQFQLPKRASAGRFLAT